MTVIAKPTGAGCNLDCQYCFFLSKELLYDVPRQLMSEETLRLYIQRFLEASPDGEVTMLWQGGEPTLRGLDFFRKVVELCEELRRPAQQVGHALQTNGTLIDERWAQFLRQEDFLVGVSVDGPQELHDVYRVNRAGRGTHELVVRGWEHLQRAGVRCNVLCTVHAANQDHGVEVYRYLRDSLGAHFIQFIPIVERVSQRNLEAAEAGWRGQDGTRLLYRQVGRSTTSRSVLPERYGNFLSAVFDEWVVRDVGTVFVQDFDAALSSLFGIYSSCVHAPQCGNNLALEFNGDVYTCDHWVEPDWLLGSIEHAPFDELVDSLRMRRFARKKQWELTKQCCRCPFLRLCWGGCPKDRFTNSIDGEPGHSYLCAGYSRFYAHALADLGAMAQLVRANRAPAQVMDPAVRSALRG
ncbi:Anaerobic sulfatase-maturating enzyme [Actinomyces bovis]|uniref:Anaerobic sulfatase-maturating enzyme n=1 Tax=Actinomyces bovis TaxID=1658 RepID=A0ABY1VLN9_9ACTO|nr:Anaerobic sulfatase-maturating enzyme [Actinomyces bovis]VEG54394.1 Anaerobic sulfatase-maturating enzyme [Actinomyces israelii]